MTSPTLKASDLRKLLIDQPVAPNVPVTIDGTTFFVRTPLIEDQTRWQNLASVKVSADGADVQFNAGRSVVAAAVILAVDEVGTPLFTDGDMDALLMRPKSSTFGKLAAHCSAIFQKDGADEGKKSGETSATAGVTPSP